MEAESKPLAIGRLFKLYFIHATSPCTVAEDINVVWIVSFPTSYIWHCVPIGHDCLTHFTPVRESGSVYPGSRLSGANLVMNDVNRIAMLLLMTGLLQ